MLTIAYLNNILLHAEFSAMYYTLNIVSKCRYFFISKHSRAPKRSWKIFHGGPGSPGFYFVSKRVGTLITKNQSGCTISDENSTAKTLTLECHSDFPNAIVQQNSC